jgi:hypothetical protein
MQSNPFVCLEVDEIKSPHDWSSVVVFGRYEELLDTPHLRPIRELAYNLLRQPERKWEPILARGTIQGQERPLLPLRGEVHWVNAPIGKGKPLNVYGCYFHVPILWDHRTCWTCRAIISSSSV